MKKTLLEKAKSFKKKTSPFVPTKEFEELAMAWCKDEISHTQICKALDLDNTGYRVYSMLALTLKHLYSKNKLNVSAN